MDLKRFTPVLKKELIFTKYKVVDREGRVAGSFLDKWSAMRCRNRLNSSSDKVYRVKKSH